MISTYELRRMLGLSRDGRVTMMVLNDHDEIPDFGRGIMTYSPRPTDSVFIFAGPPEKLTGTITYGKDEVKVEITFPNDNLKTTIS